MEPTTPALEISSIPNYIEDVSLLHEPDVSIYIMKKTPNFSANEQITKNKSEDQNTQNNKNERPSQQNFLPLQPRSILRSGERTKTTIAKMAENEKKDEIIENMNLNLSQKSPTFKDSLGSSPSPKNSSATKKTRQTRLFKGQIIENDIFEEKVTGVVVQRSRFSKFREKVEGLTKNTYLEIFFNILVLYALFADDVRTICLPKSTDIILDSITVVCIFVFSSEIVVSLITRKGYFNSFFFYLDIISTLTLFFDLTYVYEEIFYKSAFANRFQVSRASRAARIGTRAGRLVKFFNFDKFFLCLKQLHLREMLMLRRRKGSKHRPSETDSQSSQSLNKLPSNPALLPPAKPKLSAMKSSKASSVVLESPLTALSGLVRRLSRFAAKTLSSQAVDEMDDGAKTKESRVGKKLSELTITRLIIITLLLLLFAPVFSAEYQFDKPLHIIYGVKNLANMSKNNSNVSIADLNRTVNDFISESLNVWKPIISLTVPALNISYQWADLSTIRKADMDFVQQDNIIAYIDLRNYNALDSVMNMLRTLLVCAVFLIGAMIFSKDANDLALRPIERMIEKVNKIANNPLKALEEGIRGTNQNMETILIENAIIKIGTLLALGFGDAGSEIIAKNISKGNSGSVNPLLPGKKHYAIFGFCDIRNFTDVTEVLQEEVMLFVNTIASIVHKTIDKYIGNANKNIGDAFLLVWKIPDAEVETTPDGMKLNRTKMVKSLCDLAIISYIKTIARLNSYPQILKYNSNPKIGARITNYRVKMGFGLHLGWAIEGAIGSIYKIDASYLSPNVNIASRLEAATKQYGIPMLISDAVWDMCSNEMRRRMREIDKVTVKGSKNPIGLFTVDLNLENLQEKIEKVKSSMKDGKGSHKRKKEILMQALDNDEGKCIVILESDQTLLDVLRANYNYKDFLDTFHSAMDDYLGGKWHEAQDKFKVCLDIKPKDGPCLTILNYMEGFCFQAPEDWKGYRELTEK